MEQNPATLQQQHHQQQQQQQATLAQLHQQLDEYTKLHHYMKAHQVKEQVGCER